MNEIVKALLESPGYSKAIVSAASKEELAEAALCLAGDLRAEKGNRTALAEVIQKHLAGNSTRYIDEFFKLKCMSELVQGGLFPNAKEVTESMAAYNAVRQHIRRYRLDDPEVRVLVVGDGHTPRTGALFAMRSKWNVVSVDPNMREKWYYTPKFDRLTCIRASVPFSWTLISAEKSIIVHVHSHAEMNDSIKSVRYKNGGRFTAVAIPCCVEQRVYSNEGLEIEPDIEYQDNAIWSPCNKVLVWK